MKTLPGRKIVRRTHKNLLTGLWVAMLLTGMASHAWALQFELGNADVDFSSTFALGASYRVENRDWDLIGKPNQPEFNAPGKDYNDPSTIADDGPFQATYGAGRVPRGAWSANGDDGDLNFDTGFFSQVIKGTHELDVKFGDFGVFARANWFYDHYLMSESDDMRVDIMEDSAIEENHGYDAEMLDYFAYANFDAGSLPMSLRAGSQVVNWGESMFMLHGINSANPIDVARIRVPGAELKDALMPQGSVWTSIGLTQGIGIEGYYQYEWNATIPDSPGTYFSTNDIAGPGGNHIQLAYGQLADYHNTDQNVNFLSPASPNFLNYLVCKRLKDEEAKDSGQFGVKMDWYAEFLNQTELGFYYSNYHNKTPMVDIYGYGNYADDPTLDPGVHYRLVYPEDVQLIGMSFNTLLPLGIACGGEAAYRKDEPYQLDLPEVVFKALESGKAVNPLLASYTGISQIDGTYGPEERIKSYELLDSMNYDLNFTKIINNVLGADALTVVGEFACTRVISMPNNLRLETPGTDLSGNEKRAGDSRFIGDGDGVPGEKLQDLPEPEGVEQSPFADEFSWGYAALAKITYNNVFWNVNVSPLLVFRHDVSGIAPSSAGTFVEDRKQIAVQLGFDYQQNWSWDLGYTMYFGAEGTQDLLSDRDYVSFNLKYSI